MCLIRVIIASDLKWSKHVVHKANAVHKANKVLGLLNHTVGSENKDIFFKFVQSFGSSNLRIHLPGVVITIPSQRHP